MTLARRLFLSGKWAARYISEIKPMPKGIKPFGSYMQRNANSGSMKNGRNATKFATTLATPAEFGYTRRNSRTTR